MAKQVKCKHGRLKSPVRSPATGFIRRCKIKPKNSAGRKADRRKSKTSGRNKGSKEFHEVRHRRRRAGKGK